MAVEPKQAENAPTATPGGVAAAAAAAAANGRKRKRPSSLMALTSSLPSVEHSLEEFIAKANQTLVDASTWDAAEKNAKAIDDKQREHDAMRMKAAEHQMRDAQVREQALRRQLDGLQGKLAEAEARAAVASTGTQDGMIADLSLRLTRTDERAHDAESQLLELQEQLIQARAAIGAAQAAQAAGASGDPADLEDRVRVAEAKASKALAAAKAA